MKVKESLTIDDWIYLDNLNDCVDVNKMNWAEGWLADQNIKANWFMIDADECGVFEADDCYYVVCSGSDKDKKEWRGNFDAYPPIKKSKREPEYVDGYHYNYFLTAYKLYEYIMKYFNNNVDKPLIFIGESRGGLVEIANQLYDIFSTSKCHPSMAVTFDPPRFMRKKAIRWFNRRCSRKHIHHRAKTFFTIVGKVPPFFLGWKHFQTTLLKLPNVAGFNHINIGKSLQKLKRENKC